MKRYLPLLATVSGLIWLTVCPACQMQVQDQPSDPARLPAVSSDAASRSVAGNPPEPSAPLAAAAEDWPIWRYDSARSASTPHELPPAMTLKWMRGLPPPQPAWLWEPRQAFDMIHEPIVAGGTLFVGLHMDKLLALDAETGAEKWSFWAEGPIRFAPVYWKGRVIFGSDDGRLYCLDAASGALLWKFMAAPAERTCLGNGRLISSWPVRGGAVLADDTLYFAAGIWPFMGVFIYAIDPATGNVVWKNDKTGSLTASNPHKSKGVGGPSPQGYLAAGGGRLIVPSGRSRPAILDIKSGELLHYMTGWRYGNCLAAATDKYYFNGAYMFDLKTGGLGSFLTANTRAVQTQAVQPWHYLPVLDGATAYTADDGACHAFDICGESIPDNTKNHELENRFVQGPPPSAWKGEVVAADSLWLKAGRRLYASKGQDILAVEISEGKVSWTAKVEGTVGGMIAARGKLFVSTREGMLYCFGAGNETNRHWLLQSSAVNEDKASIKAAEILKATGADKGYCLVLGLKDGRLLEELAHKSDLHVIGVDGNAQKVKDIRGRLEAAGLYGKRAALCTGEPGTFALPPYLASLMVSENWAAVKGGFSGRLYTFLRPYGGVACLDGPASQAGTAGMPNAEKKTAGDFTLISRAGALPGSAWWTHENADSGNTCAPQDDLVKAPLAVLWFGARPQDAQGYAMLFPDRHSGAPRPRVAGGRIIVQRYNKVSAIDVYTGRVLWTREIPGLGEHYDPAKSRQGFRPRTNLVLGSNCVALPDSVYLCASDRCLRLDSGTGRQISEFKLPGNARWGNIIVWKDILIASASVLSWDAEAPLGTDAWNGSASSQLVAMDATSGKMLWNRDAVYGFRNSAIAVGGDKIFCVDILPGEMLEKLNRKEMGSDDDKPTLLALDARTGRVVWKTTENVPRAPNLAYSEKHDILIRGIQGTHYAVMGMTDADIAGKIMAYQGKDGTVLWSRFSTAYWSAFVNDDALILQTAIDLRTGKGLGWSWTKTNRGCDPPLGSRHLITFRSSSAGFYDIDERKGPSHLSGFRPSCSGSLIVADGVLNAPMYGIGCECNISNMTSLGLIHDPDMAKWNPDWRN